MRYFTETKKFYYGFLIILPFLFVYEWGLKYEVLGKNINGADAILRFILLFLFQVIGVSITRWLVGVILTVGAIWFFLYLKKKNIRINVSYLLGMLLESLALAFLFGLAVSILLTHSLPDIFTFSVGKGVESQLSFFGIVGFWPKIISGIGAGLFEELLFRALLLRFACSLFSGQTGRVFGADAKTFFKASVLVSSLFTFIHFGSVSGLGAYISIFISSMMLSYIFQKRGYGITALTHSFYDIYLMFGIIS